MRQTVPTRGHGSRGSSPRTVTHGAPKPLRIAPLPGWTPVRARRSRVPLVTLAVVGILVVTATGSFLVRFVTEHGVHYERSRLKARSSALAKELDIASVKALTGQPTDEDTPAFKTLARRLKHDQATHREVRFNYLMGLNGSSVIFLLDSTDPGSIDYSPPGQVYDEASPELRRAFTSGEPFVEGPTSDRWGTWVSGMSPIKDPASGRVIAVMGMDVDATRWQVTVGACRAFSYVVIGLLVWAIVLFVRRLHAYH